MIDHLLSIGPIRRAIWKCWYPYLTRKLREEDVQFLNYAFQEVSSPGPVLTPEDEVNRGCIQLYHHVATQAELRGKEVLEVSCGHGGGASYLTRALQTSHYTGLDLNHEGIRFCRERHRIDGLEFVRGDAENLPFGNESFDAVINVEASHCYPSFPRFLSEVTRVLRPGGHFLYADFRFASGLDEWETALAAPPLRQLHTRVINAEVLRGMEHNSPRSAALIARQLPGFLQSLGRDFAGVTGSRIHAALREGHMSYRSFSFEKPVNR